MRKKISRMTAGLLFTLLCLIPMLKADASTLVGDYLAEKGIELGISADVSFYNKYVWRGFLLDDDSVLQPGITFSLGGFEGGFWGSWDMQSDDGHASDEVDGWIGYSFDLGFLGDYAKMVSLSFGHTWYDFPEADLYSKEFYFGISFDTFLSPYITWYKDYADEENGGADGNYIMVGIGHSFTLIEEYGIGLDLGMEYGYNDNAFIDGKGGYLLSTMALTIPLTENVTLTPNIGYSVPFADLKSGGGWDQKEQFYGGVSLGFSF